MLILLISFALVIPAPAFSLKLLAKENFAAVVDVDGNKAGGISGISQDPNGDWLLLSDDKGQYGPPRFFKASFQLPESGKKLLQWKSMLPLLESGAKSFKKFALDTEAILRLPHSILVSSEGLPGRILEFTPEGAFLKNWELPDYYLKGLRKNQGLEALCTAPDFSWVLSLPENALSIDAKMPRPGTTTALRAQLWRKQNDAYKLDEYFFYQMETPAKFGKGVDSYSWGVTECLSLSTEEILVLERGFYQKLFNYYFSIRLYKFNLKTHRKELVLDLNSLETNDFSLDNLEAMYWGPPQSNGKKSLLIMSDSNFLPFQNTQLLVFSVE